MKRTKRIVGLCVCMMLLVSLMVLPASAATNPDFYHFPLVTKSMGNGYMSAAVAAQKFLLLYDPITYSRVKSSGGTDGFFGSGSANAAEYFQAAEHLGVDGKVGSLTWLKMCELMSSVEGYDSFAPYYYLPNNSGKRIASEEVIYYINGYCSVNEAGAVKEVFYNP